MPRLLKTIIKSVINTIKHDGVEHAGYMAFMSLLSLFPFLFFMVSITGAVGESHIGASFIQYVFASLPEDVVSSIKPRVEEIISGPSEGLLTFSLLGAIWTSSSTVEGLRTILNRVYHIGNPPTYIWRRLLSIAQFLLLSAIAIVVAFILLVIPTLWEKLSHILFIEATNINNFYLFDNILQIMKKFRIVIAETLLIVSASTLYYLIPNAKLKISETLPGSMLDAILWSISWWAISLYLNNFKQITTIYGSLAGIIATLLFFYVNNLIFILGAEFNYLYKIHHKQRMRY